MACGASASARRAADASLATEEQTVPKVTCEHGFAQRISKDERFNRWFEERLLAYDNRELIDYFLVNASFKEEDEESQRLGSSRGRAKGPGLNRRESTDSGSSTSTGSTCDTCSVAGTEASSVAGTETPSVAGTEAPWGSGSHPSNYNRNRTALTTLSMTREEFRAILAPSVVPFSGLSATVLTYLFPALVATRVAPPVADNMSDVADEDDVV